MLYQDIKYDEIRKKLRTRLSKLESSTAPPAGTSKIATDDGLGYVAVDAGSPGDAVEIVITEDSGVAAAVSVSGDVITVALKGKKGGNRSEATIITTAADNDDWAGKVVTLTPNVPDAVAEVITEGVEWTKGGDEDASATALALAITNKEVRSSVVIGVTGSPGDNEGFQFEIDRKSYVITFKTGGLGAGAKDSIFNDDDPLFYATLNAGGTVADTVAEMVTLMGSLTNYTATDVGGTGTAVELKAAVGLAYPEAEIHTPFYNSVSTRKQRDASPGNLQTTSEVMGTNHFSATASGGTVTIKAEMGFLGRTAGADGNAATVTTDNSSAAVEDFDGGTNPLETDVLARLINESPEASAKITVVEQPLLVPSAKVINVSGGKPSALDLDQKYLDLKYDPDVNWSAGTVFSLEQNKDALTPTLYVVTSFTRHFDEYYPDLLTPGHRMNKHKYTARLYFAQLNDSSKGLSRAYPAFPTAGNADVCSVFTKTFFDAEALEEAEFTGGVVVNANIAYAANPICLRVEGGPYESGAANAYKGTYRQQAAITGTIGGNGTWTPTDGSVPWFRQDDGSMNLYLAVNAVYGGGTERVWTMNDSYGRALTDSSCYPSGNSMEAAIQGGVYPHEIDLDDANLGWPTGWPAPFVISCP